MYNDNILREDELKVFEESVEPHQRAVSAICASLSWFFVD